MKKLRNMLVSLMLVVGLVVPVNVFAEDTNIANPSEDVSAGIYGSFKKGDVTWTYTDRENGIKEWTFMLTPSKAFTSEDTIAIKLVPTGVSVQKVTTDNSKLFLASNDNNTLLLKPANTGLKSGEKVQLIKVTTKDTATDKCDLSISPITLNCSTNISGYYFNNNGEEVTKEEYDQVCAGVTPDDNPNTGNAVPYIAITGGLIAIAGVYLYSKKSKKMYRI